MPDIRPITDHEFSLFQVLIHRETGIYLRPIKKALLVGRLSRRIRTLGLRSFAEYYRRIVQGSDEIERTVMLDNICTNETSFFRHPKEFEFLKETVFPDWMAQRTNRTRSSRIRAWSTACSTGAEAYSLAMVLLERFPPSEGWDIEILATDFSSRALETAQKGVWPIKNSETIPPNYLKTFMLKGVRSQRGMIKAASEIRSVIRFQHLNLNDFVYPVSGSYDLIFCRNVLIYFDFETRKRIARQLLQYLSPGGYFVLGQAESLGGLLEGVRAVIPSVYIRLDDPASSSRRTRTETLRTK